MKLVLNKGKILGNIANSSFQPFEYSSEKRLKRAGETAEEDLAIQGAFDKLCAWEQGKLSKPETLAFFQDLVSTGQAWKSTGAVRRMAAQLIRGGLIHR